jgi:hypothetical protein
MFETRAIASIVGLLGASMPCTYSAIQIDTIVLPMPFLAFFTKEVIRITMILQAEAAMYGGCYWYYKKYPVDENDAIHFLLVASYVLSVVGYGMMIREPALPPGCTYSGEHKRQSSSYDSPCRACCACKTLSRGENPMGVDSATPLCAYHTCGSTREEDSYEEYLNQGYNPSLVVNNTAPRSPATDWCWILNPDVDDPGTNCFEHMSFEMLDWEKNFGGQSGPEMDYPMCRGDCAYRPEDYEDVESGMSGKCGIICTDPGTRNNMMLAGWDTYTINKVKMTHGMGPNQHYNTTMEVPLPDKLGVQLYITGTCVCFFFLMLFTTCCSHRILPFKRKAYSFEPPKPEEEPDFNESQDDIPVVQQETRSKLAAMWNKLASEKKDEVETEEDRMRRDIAQRAAKIQGRTIPKAIAPDLALMSPPTQRTVNSNITILPSLGGGLDTFFQTKKRGAPIFPSLSPGADGPRLRIERKDSDLHRRPSDMQQEAQELY